MDEHLWRRRFIYMVLWTVPCISILGFVYLASYAPYLRFNRSRSSNPYYRSPSLYRGADWCLVKSPAEPILLWWGKCLGVEQQTLMQGFYFGQGISDPPSELEFNMSDPNESTRESDVAGGSSAAR